MEAFLICCSHKKHQRGKQIKDKGKDEKIKHKRSLTKKMEADAANAKTDNVHENRRMKTDRQLIDDSVPELQTDACCRRTDR